MSNLALPDQFQFYLDQVQGVLQRIPWPKVRYGLQVVLVVWLLSLLADLFWLLVPLPAGVTGVEQGQPVAISTPSRPVAQGAAVDVREMQGWHLFGAAQVAAMAEGEDAGGEVAALSPDAAGNAVKSRLPLKLAGVIKASDEKGGYAIIAAANASGLYKVGEKIEGFPDVTLAKVEADRAILNNRGSSEFLLLYDDEANQVADAGDAPVRALSTNAPKTVVDRRNDAQFSEMATNYRDRLVENPMSLADIIKVSVAKDGEGNVIGYRIRPGRDRKQFADFGLQSGDIVTSINGMPLNDPARAMELYGQLRDLKEASFVVQRGGEQINMMVGLKEN